MAGGVSMTEESHELLPLTKDELERMRRCTPKHIQAAVVASLGMYHERISAYETPLVINLGGERHDIPSHHYKNAFGELWSAGLLSTLGYRCAITLRAAQ